VIHATHVFLDTIWQRENVIPSENVHLALFLITLNALLVLKTVHLVNPHPYALIVMKIISWIHYKGNVLNHVQQDIMVINNQEFVWFVHLSVQHAKIIITHALHAKIWEQLLIQ
jgi:hypothetical protein